MAKSMTAFGRAKCQSESKIITVEMKSVNNRFLDISVRVPKQFSFLEEKIKGRIKESGIERGKIDVFVTIDILSSDDNEVIIDRAYLDGYVNALYEIRDRYNLEDDISVMRVASNKDIFLSRPKNTDDADYASGIWNEFCPVLDDALRSFSIMRENEAERLVCDLAEKKKRLVSIKDNIKKESALTVARYRERLEDNLRTTLSELGIEADESRIITECAIFADRIATDEEIVRLESHFASFDEIISSGDSVGRKLDFLLQEMNRETNTIGSKCQDVAVSKLVIEMKNELEKIREQVQNLE